MNNEFNLEHQYELYLQRVGLKEEQMHPLQKKQLRQTFMGACGQMLILMRDEVGALPEDQAIEVCESMINQVGEFFINQTERKN